MKKTIINTGGAIAIATVAAVCSNEAQAAACASGEGLTNVLTGAATDLVAGGVTLVTGSTYLVNKVCTSGGITIPASATVTIVDSLGLDGDITLGKGATLSYYCETGKACKAKIIGPSGSTDTATMNLVGPYTVVADGADSSKVTLVAKKDMILTGPASVLGYVLSVPAGVTVTTATLTGISAKMTSGGIIKAAVANTVITGK
jgi:hypothetical protein